jgi:hypothetical protein
MQNSTILEKTEKLTYIRLLCDWPREGAHVTLQRASDVVIVAEIEPECGSGETSTGKAGELALAADHSPPVIVFLVQKPLEE